MGDDFDVFEVALLELATTSGQADRLPLFIPQGHTWQVATQAGTWSGILAKLRLSVSMNGW
jgi:hypothetical protein